MTKTELLKMVNDPNNPHYIVLGFRNGGLGVVINSVVKYDCGGFDYLSLWDENLKSVSSYEGSNLDIIRIWDGQGYATQFSNIFKTNKLIKTLELEVTMQEIADKFGIDVKCLKIKK